MICPGVTFCDTRHQPDGPQRPVPPSPVRPHPCKLILRRQTGQSGISLRAGTPEQFRSSQPHATRAISAILSNEAVCISEKQINVIDKTLKPSVLTIEPIAHAAVMSGLLRPASCLQVRSPHELSLPLSFKHFCGHREGWRWLTCGQAHTFRCLS